MIAYSSIIGTPRNEPLPKDLLVDWIMASSQIRWAPISQIDPVNPFDATKAGLYIPCLQGPSAVLWNIRTTSPPKATGGWLPWPKHASPKWNSRESCENHYALLNERNGSHDLQCFFSKSSFFFGWELPCQVSIPHDQIILLLSILIEHKPFHPSSP